MPFSLKSALSLGSTSDAPAQNGSAMARLAYLAGLIGAASPSAGSEANLFQFLWQLNNFLNGGAAIPGLGQQSDGASETGSANSKLAAVLGRQGGGTPAYYQAENATTTAVTLCNISGEGTLAGIVVVGDPPIVTIVKDGTTIINGVTMGEIVYSSSGQVTTIFTVPIEVHYNSSLLITFITSNSTTNIGLAAVVNTGVA